MEEHHGSTDPVRHLVLVLKDNKDWYCIYSIPESEIANTGTNCDGGNLPAPDKVLSRKEFPTMMSFAPAVGKDGLLKLYMAGGINSNKRFDRVSIYDPVSKDLTEGPPMCSGKVQPILITVDDPQSSTKLYAISRFIPGPVYFDEPDFDMSPHFEVLDISGTGIWHPLPSPIFSEEKVSYYVNGWLVYDSFNILISVKDFGIYMYNTRKPHKGWKHMSHEVFPFYGYAQFMRVCSSSSSSSSSSPSWYVGWSNAYNGLRGYHIEVFRKLKNKEQPLVVVSEIAFDKSTDCGLPREYPLRRLYATESLIIPASVSSLDDKVLLIQTGFDKPVSINCQFDRSSTFCHVELLPCEISYPEKEDKDKEQDRGQKDRKLSLTRVGEFHTLKPCVVRQSFKVEREKNLGKQRMPVLHSEDLITVQRCSVVNKEEGGDKKRKLLVCLERDGLLRLKALGYRSYRACPIAEIMNHTAAAFFVEIQSARENSSREEMGERRGNAACSGL